MANSSKAVKPRKPYPEFPLTPHQTGQWCKKFNGRTVYFGSDWKQALERYKAEVDYHRAGVPVPQSGKGLSVLDACNRFLSAKDQQRQAGEIGARHFADLKDTCGRIIGAFGRTRLVATLTAQDFEHLRAILAERYGPSRLTSEVSKIRSIFTYLWEAGCIENQVRFGPHFRPPAKKRVRAKRNADRMQNGGRMFTPAQLKKLLKTPDPRMRAMILLGVQAGLGNADVGTLPISAVDLASGWIDFPRPKTLVERRFPLWPETQETMREALACRPEPRLSSGENLFFLCPRGRECWREMGRNWPGVHFRMLLVKTGVYRPGLSFYSLRHTFRTVADRCTDRPAVDCVMGHTDRTIAASYRESIDDDRLGAVVEVVREWLFAKGGDYA